jgi:hypothetical protein
VEQRILDDDARVIRAYMREARSIDDIARGVNAARRRSQMVVDNNASIVVLDTRRLLAKA